MDSSLKSVYSSTAVVGNPTTTASPAFPSTTSSTWNDAAANSTYAGALSSNATSVTPDVVANPWNTSLLWSSGIVDNRDPRSSFWPAQNWINSSVPSNVNTAPISYYYASSTAGDSVNFYFTGHGLSVLDFRGPHRGKYNVTIDNASSVVIDAYSETDELAQASGSELPPVIWTSDTFDEGTHSVLMSNLNNITDMQFWGVVINPNNYRPGKSFMHTSSDAKLIIIASTVTAVIMVLIFILVGSVVYYYKLVRPRRRFQAQMDADRKDESLLPSSSANADGPVRPPATGSSSQLRLNTNFLSSQGDLGRVPSRVTATTNESQYWLRPETEMGEITDTRQSTRISTLFQEVRLDSQQPSALSSPTDLSPASELDPTSTVLSAELSDPLSPLSPTNNAYAPAYTPTHHFSFWEAGHAQERQPPTHHHSSSLNLHFASNNPFASARDSSHWDHARLSSTPGRNPFQDPSASASGISLVRTASRRPLPTPPSANTPISPMTVVYPSTTPLTPDTARQSQNGGTDGNSQLSSSVARSASQRYRIEQDACSLHLSEDGIVDDHTGERLLPPPYAPRGMGREFG